MHLNNTIQKKSSKTTKLISLGNVCKNNTLEIYKVYHRIPRSHVFKQTDASVTKDERSSIPGHTILKMNYFYAAGGVEGHMQIWHTSKITEPMKNLINYQLGTYAL